MLLEKEQWITETGISPYYENQNPFRTFNISNVINRVIFALLI